MTQKLNDSRCSSKYFNPLIPSNSHPSLPFSNTSGSLVNLSNGGRNSNSLRQRVGNLNQITEKLVQADPMHDVFPPLLLGELKKQTNLLIAGLEDILKSLDPDSKRNIFSLRSHRKETDKIISAGDVERNVIECPAFWKELGPTRVSHPRPDAENTELNTPQNNPAMLKEKLNKLLECALKIRNIIPAEMHYPHSGGPLNSMPTGAIETPGTQTEPVDTYVKFLGIIEEAARSNEITDSRNKSLTQNSPERMRMRINDTRTVDTKGYQQKSIEVTTDRKSSNHSLDNVLNETLNRKIIPNSFNNGKSLNFDDAVPDCKSDHSFEEGTENQSSDTFGQSKSFSSSLIQRSKKIPEMPSADTINLADGENFSLKDYISALRQVSMRNPGTKRIREFSGRSKGYFDFDDYFEKLVSMNNRHQIVVDSINSYNQESSHLKQL